jgi:membrane protein CcdC involved in cytochrome C biogenesis
MSFYLLNIIFCILIKDSQFEFNNKRILCKKSIIYQIELILLYKEARVSLKNIKRNKSKINQFKKNN